MYEPKQELKDRVLSGQPVSREHLSSPEAVIDARWIASAIKKGRPVSITGVTVAGFLELRGMRSQGEVSFDDCRFAGFVDLSHAEFLRVVRFTKCEFSDGACFDAAKFRSELAMDRSRIDPVSRDSTAAVLRLLGADEPSMVETTWFTDTEFFAAVSLRSCRFNSPTDFTRAQFHSVAFFGDATFSSTVTFSEVRAFGNVQFDRVQFQMGCNLNEAAFAATVEFKHARVGRYTNAPKAGETLCLDNVNVTGSLRLTNATILLPLLARNLRVARLEATGIRCSRGIDLDNAHAGGSIALDNAIILGKTTLADVTTESGITFHGSTIHSEVGATGARVAWIDLDNCDATPWRGSEVESESAALNENKPVHAKTSNRDPSLLRELFIASFVNRFRKEATSAAFNFSHSSIRGNVAVRGSTISNLVMRGAVVGGEVWFDNCTLGTHYGADLDFRWCEFSGPVHLQQVRLFARLLFDGSRFEDSATFALEVDHLPISVMSRDKESLAGDASDISFSMAHFAANLTVQTENDQGAPRTRTLSFSNATFRGETRLVSIHRVGLLDLRGAQLRGLALFSAKEPDAESAGLPPFIVLGGCEYSHLNLFTPLNLLCRAQQKLRLLPDLRIERYERQPFSMLESVLRTRGDAGAAAHVYLAGRKAERRTMPPLSRFINALWGHLTNYGVRPYRMAVLAIAVILAASTVFVADGALIPSSKDSTNSVHVGAIEPPNEGVGSAVGFAFAQFLPIDLPIKKRLEPSNSPVRVDFVRTWRIRPTAVATMLTLMGWILVPLGLAAVSGVLVRKSEPS